jgi:hypothetical protein
LSHLGNDALLDHRKSWPAPFLAELRGELLSVDSMGEKKDEKG